MKPFSLEEYLKNPDRKIVTRDGKSVRIICTDFHNINYPIIIEVEGLDEPLPATREGRHISLAVEDRFDLFFASEKHEGWINIFRGKDNPFTGNIIFASKEEAEESGRHCCGFTKDLYMTSGKVEWEE